MTNRAKGLKSFFFRGWKEPTARIGEECIWRYLVNKTVMGRRSNVNEYDKCHVFQRWKSVIGMLHAVTLTGFMGWANQAKPAGMGVPFRET